MKKITPEQMQTFESLQREKSKQSICKEVTSMDPALASAAPDDELDETVEWAMSDAESLGLQTVSAAALLTLMRLVCKVDPESAIYFEPVIAILGSTKLAEHERLEEASNILFDLQYGLQDELFELEDEPMEASQIPPKFDE